MLGKSAREDLCVGDLVLPGDLQQVSEEVQVEAVQLPGMAL